MRYYKHKNYNFVTVIEIPKDEISRVDFAICKQPTETLSQFYKRQSEKPAIITNGGFYNMSNGDTGMTFVDEGKTIKRGDWALRGFGKNSKGQMVYGHLDKYKDWVDFVGAYPVLTENYKPEKITIATEINYKARRTVYGETDTTLFIFLVEGQGMNFVDMQIMLKDMGIKNAVNYDGGGSTNAYVLGKKLTSTSFDRSVDNVICVYLKNEKEEVAKKYHTVIAGKSLWWKTANDARSKIITIPDKYYAGYKNAFVKRSGLFYFSQVGIYSKETSAIMVRDHLLSWGINAEII